MEKRTRTLKPSLVKSNEPYRSRPIQQVLDDIKRKHDLPSDYKLSLFLGLGETAVANYRKGRSLPDFEAILSIAKALDEDHTLLMLEVESQRAKSMGAKLAWAGAAAIYAHAQRTITVAAAAIAILGIGGTPPPAAAQSVTSNPPVYIMSNDGVHA